MFYSGKKKDGKLESVESKSVKALSSGFTGITKSDYDHFVSVLPKPIVPDIKAEYAAATDKVKFIAKQLGLE